MTDLDREFYSAFTCPLFFSQPHKSPQLGAYLSRGREECAEVGEKAGADDGDDRGGGGVRRLVCQAGGAAVEKAWRKSSSLGLAQGWSSVVQRGGRRAAVCGAQPKSTCYPRNGTTSSGLCSR